MAIMKTKLSLAIFLFFLLSLLCSNLAIAREETETEDPELKTCKHQCKQQLRYSERDKQICAQKCEKYHEMKKHREEKKEQGEEEGCEADENPYVFKYRDFETIVDTEDGNFSVLQDFTKKSKLLQNIENYGLAILEARERTFLSPHHFNSEVIFFNIKGRGIIGLVMEDKTERFNLQPGDIIRVPAGTPIYVVNRDDNEKLYIAMLHIQAFASANFQAFFEPAGRNPESVLTAFSWKVLESAFKTPQAKLERVFDEQRMGRIFKIPREEVQALAPKRSIWPFSSKGPLNLFNNHPTFSNQFGRLFEVGPNDYNLEGLNLLLSFANITKGSMSTIYYNTHADKIALVVDGEGHFEMACPHVSSRSHSEKHSSPSYKKISARLRAGTVFVVPAGHPFVTISSKKNNLMILCFEVNAQRNKKLTFAGKGNIMSALDKKAKELAFDFSAEKVDEIFDRDEQFFFPFQESQKNGRADI